MTDESKSKLPIEVALKNREFEIQLFWQRSNYFLVLITAVGIALFAAKDAPLLQVLISGFGVVVCVLWFRTNLGSRFWQVFWEGEVEKLAEEFELKSFLVTIQEIKAQRRTEAEKEKGWNRFIDLRVAEKPSVTRSMILLSIVAFFFWVSLFTYHAVRFVYVGQGVTPAISAPPPAQKAPQSEVSVSSPEKPPVQPSEPKKRPSPPPN